MERLWSVAFAIGGMAAVGAFVFWSLYSKWLSLPIFSKLTQEQTFVIMLVFLSLTFLSLIIILIKKGRKNPKINSSKLNKVKGKLSKLTNVYDTEVIEAERLLGAGNDKDYKKGQSILIKNDLTLKKIGQLYVMSRQYMSESDRAEMEIALEKRFDSTINAINFVHQFNKVINAEGAPRS